MPAGKYGMHKLLISRPGEKPINKLRHNMENKKKDKSRIAYNRIKEIILTFQIKPGQQLGLEYLKEEIKVSTTPIREALHRLVEEGYIFQIRNRGFFVSDLDAKELEDLYETREALELFAIKKIIQENRKINQAVINKIQKNMDLYFKYAHEEPHRNRLFLDREFHVLIAQQSGNLMLCKILDSTFEKLIYKRNVVELFPQRGKEASKEHYEIFRLLLQWNENEVIEYLRNHIQIARKKLLSLLETREEYLKL